MVVVHSHREEECPPFLLPPVQDRLERVVAERDEVVAFGDRAALALQVPNRRTKISAIREALYRGMRERPEPVCQKIIECGDWLDRNVLPVRHPQEGASPFNGNRVVGLGRKIKAIVVVKNAWQAAFSEQVRRWLDSMQLGFGWNGGLRGNIRCESSEGADGREG